MAVNLFEDAILHVSEAAGARIYELRVPTNCKPLYRHVLLYLDHMIEN